MPGDVITAVGALPIGRRTELAEAISDMAPGTIVKIDILRDGSERTFSIKLGELPVTPFKAASVPTLHVPTALGLSLAPATTKFEGAGNRGTVITDVDPNGLAAEKGLAAGDIILDVSGNPVATSDDVQNALRRAEEGGKHDILVRIKTRDGGFQFIALRPLPLGKAEVVH